MRLIQRLREEGRLAPERADALEALADGRLFPVGRELRAALYLGSLLLVYGVGATVKKHVELGPAAILASLSAGVALCFYYCATRAAPYAPCKVESPTPAFDYALYLGCALLGVEFGYLETRYALLREWWDLYLLAASGFCLALAYRCDNRLVLSLGLVSLAGWFGVKLERFGLFAGAAWRGPAFVYGVLLWAAGGWLKGRGLKAHFTDAYWTLAAHAMLGSLWVGMFAARQIGPDWIGLTMAAFALAAWAYRAREFSYFLYGAFYAYSGVTYLLSRGLLRDPIIWALYALASAGGAVYVLFFLRRGMEER